MPLVWRTDLRGRPRRLAAAEMRWSCGRRVHHRKPRSGQDLERLTREKAKLVATLLSPNRTALMTEGRRQGAGHCHASRHNAVRLQLHALAYNLVNFLRTLALPEEIEHWSLTTLREKLIKTSRPDRALRPLRGIPAGRGRDAARPVRRDPPPDRMLAAEAAAVFGIKIESDDPTTSQPKAPQTALTSPMGISG
jgi:Transposase DDE domain group 1